MSSAERSAPRFTGTSIAVIGIALGLAVAVCITRKDEYFFGAAAYTWLPQAAVLFAAILCKASRGALGGIAAAMALYLYLFDIWAADQAMAWLFYFFSFPGILIGALLAIVTPSREAFEAPIAFAWAVLGIALGLVGVWFWAR